MSDTSLAWLQEWYASHVDGDWEHSNGIRIDTLDNPGWSLEIDIGNLELRDRRLEPVVIERSEQDWVHARVRDGTFEAFGGARNLAEMVAIFRGWVEGHPHSEAA